jgi:hypothetical protein
MQHVTQTYSDLMLVTNTKIELPKCSWYLLTFYRGGNGKYCLQKKSKIHYNLHICDQVTKLTIVTAQLDSSTEQKLLSKFMAPAHVLIKQRNELVEKGRNFSNLINTDDLSCKDKLVAFHSVLWPGLTYPLAVASLSMRDLKKVSWKFGTTLWHS